MIFGSFTMVANKLLLKTETRGFEDNEGETSKFDKTIYASLVMFFGMAFCYPWYEITQIIDLVRHPPSKSGSLSLNAEDDQEHEQPKQSFAETAKVSFLYSLCHSPIIPIELLPDGHSCNLRSCFNNSYDNGDDLH